MDRFGSSPENSGVRRSLTLASIDIGTNTILLLVVQILPGGNMCILHEEEQIPRLGKGMGETGLLQPGAMGEAIKVLERYKEIATTHQADPILAVGTAVLRQASNAWEFIGRVQDALALNIRVLSEQEEARLSFLGALANKSSPKGTILVIDIGGGSTEFILGEGKEYQQALSVDIGSVVLTEKFFPSDPVQSEELDRCAKFVRGKLISLKEKGLQKVDHLIGTGGTVTTLAAVNQKLNLYDADRIDGYRLRGFHLGAMISEFASRTLQQRLSLPGLYPGRADVILAGAIILYEAMRLWEVKEVTVSHWGLRHGLIIEWLKEHRMAGYEE